jgi:hypothetical protein
MGVVKAYLQLKAVTQVVEGLKGIESGGYLPLLVITAQPDHKLRAGPMPMAQNNIFR